MDQDIETFLRANVTGDVLVILRKAVQAFDAFELVDHEDSILDLIFSASATEEQSLTGTIVSEFRAKLEYILGLHDITMLDAAPLEMLVEMCFGLKAIDAYLDMDSVIDICDGEESSTERLADVMALVTPYTAEDIMLNIDVVNEGLVEKIRALVSQSPEEAPEAANAVAIDAINRYRNQIAPDELSYKSMLDAGLPLGMPFKSYMSFYTNTNTRIDLSDPLHMKQFVQDLIGLILISSDGYANPIMYVQQSLTAVTSDINISMKADIIAKQILQRFVK